MTSVQEADNARLCELWAQETLDAAQWAELYQRVRTRLLHAHAPELDGLLANDREAHIHDFFTQKTVINSRGPLKHVNVLVTYFRNYLRDQLDSRQRAPTLTDDGELPETACASEPDDEEFERLRQASGLDAAAAAAAARAFLGTLDADDFASLALHQCPDNGIPLSKLARESAIASYHYKARKLGITLRKTDTPADYAATRIGAWLTGPLGLTPLAEHQHEVLTAFRILCLEALRMQQSRL